MTSEKSRPFRLLVVDDEPIVGRRLQQVFSKLGLEVAVFTRGGPALAAMAERPFDVVVTDLKMEGMDGMEVLAQVRRRSPRTKVIIITGYAEQETARAAFSQGAFAFIAKPFRLDELKRAVLRALEDEPAGPRNGAPP
ncbi:MAG: response regulator [Desulfobacteraceae bacterium]|nr:response regulator [Desulfobacteraceae bacterium]